MCSSGSGARVGVLARLAQRSSQANSSGLTMIDSSAPARIRSWPSFGRISSCRPRPARMKENSPICARLAEISQRGAIGLAERAHDRVGRDRLAEHDDQERRQHLPAGARPGSSGRTACRPRRRTAPRTHRAAAAISVAAWWLNSDSLSSMPAKNAPSANDTPNSRRRAERHAQRDRQHAQREQLARAGAGDALEDPRDHAAADDQHHRDEARRPWRGS